jgi:hypothetical protein
MTTARESRERTRTGQPPRKTLKSSHHQPAAEPDRKDFFIEVLAEYLVKDQATRSIRLEMGDSEAKMWAKVRGATPLFGYPTQTEAVKLLREWLLGRG